MTARQDSGILRVPSRATHPRISEVTLVKSIRLLIADDQPRARQSLKALLATWPQAQEIREAANGKQAVALVEEFQPDVVLMDVRMPEMDGLEAARLIKARWPWVKIIMLSMYTEYAADAMTVEADAFFSKGAPPEQLLDTLTAVAAHLEKKESDSAAAGG
jgi:YesN/AraC family two-component response regulator